MTNEEEKIIEWLKTTSLDEIVQKIFSYISKLDRENCEQKADMNKLINYIAIRENKTHEEVCKEFELGE